MATSSATFPIGARLRGKVCIVTGSSSGLGRAIALAFAAQGTRLVVCADLKSAPESDFMAEDAGTQTEEVICCRYGENKGIFVKTNVTVGTEVEALVQAAVKAGGRLDVLVFRTSEDFMSDIWDSRTANRGFQACSMVNNAGIGGTEHHGMVHEMTEETWDNVMAINSRSVFLGCKYACAQFMNQAPHSSGQRGWIINTSSIMGLVGQPVSGAAYCASKGAVTLLTKQIAVEYAKHKIHCNCICPGHLRTPMTHDQYQDREMRTAISALTPWGDEWGAAEDVAKGYVYLASDDAAYVTGVALPIDGGYCAQ